MPNRRKDLLADYSSGGRPNKPVNQPLKIGFVFDDSLDSSDGVAQQVKTLGAWLSGQGHRVSYLVGETRLKQWAGGRVYSLTRNQTVIFNANRLSVPFPANRRRIRDVLSYQQFDVLHVQMPHSPFMAQRVIKAAAADVAVVGTFHIVPSGPLASVGSRFLRLMYGRNLRLFDEIISVSPPAAAFAKNFFGLNSHVLPNMVDVKKFKKLSGQIKNRPNQIVFLGRLVKRKGCLELLKAFGILHLNQPQACLVIIGDGPERTKLERYVKNHRLQAAVQFAGHVEESDKPARLASAAVACFPATGGESFGVVLIEAMAAGAGVVLGGNNSGYASVLGAQTELLVDPKQTTLFAARLARLLEDRPLALKLHVWQESQVKKYDVQSVGPQILGIYQQAIAKRRLKGHNLNHAA